MSHTGNKDRTQLLHHSDRKGGDREHSRKNSNPPTTKRATPTQPRKSLKETSGNVSRTKEQKSSKLKPAKTGHAEKPQKSETKALVSSTSNQIGSNTDTIVRSTEPARPSTGGHTIIKIKIERAPEVDIDESITRMAKQQEEPQIAQGLLTSYMASQASISHQQAAYGNAIQGIQYGTDSTHYSNIVNINVSGSAYRVWTTVYFGENPKSEGCRMLVDTGSAYTWVNERVYRQKCNKYGADVGVDGGIDVSFRYNMGAGPIVEVKGSLYKNVVSFGHEDTAACVRNQSIAIVEESHDQPVVRQWREKFKVIGVLGIGPSLATKGTVDGDPNRLVKSAMHNLLGKETGIVALSVRRGLLHIGGYAPSPGIIWAPLNKKWGIVNNMVTYVEATYQNMAFTGSRAVLMDTGTPYISVPPDVMKAYLMSLQSTGVITVKYDSNVHTYYIPDDAEAHLGDLRFKFGGVEPGLRANQLISAANYRESQWGKNATPGRQYLAMRPHALDSKIILGYHWLKDFDVVGDSANDLVGISPSY